MFFEWPFSELFTKFWFVNKHSISESEFSPGLYGVAPRYTLKKIWHVPLCLEIIDTL